MVETGYSRREANLMSGTTPPRNSPHPVQAVICEGRDLRIVSLDQAKELEQKNLGAARWLDKKFPVHRHAGGHSLIGEDGACENCRVGGSCERKKISALMIPPKARVHGRSKWTPARSTKQETELLLAEMKGFIKELPKDLQDSINSTAWSLDGLRKLRDIARSHFVQLSEVDFHVTRSLEPDEGQPLGPSLWADPRGRAAVLGALLKGLGTGYATFDEAVRAGEAAQGLKQGRVERAIRRVVAEERAGSE